MKKKKSLMLLSMPLIAGLMFAACRMDGGGDGGTPGTDPGANPGANPVVVSAFSLNGLVTAPVRGAAPDTTGINTAQYTGSVAWQTSNGTAHTGAFAASTVYKAVLTLTAKTGYTFSGVVSGTFSYSGATVTNAANSGTVTITFPATAAEGEDTVVNAFSLDGLVTAPVRGEAPDTTGINTAQYTGSVAWQTSGGAAHTGAFAASTVYKAVLTLSAKPGYTFTGVVSGAFSYTGATVTNAANSGTVTITFPATGASGASGALTGISVGFTGPTGKDIILDGGFWLSKSDSAYSSLTISVKNTGDYDTFRWLVDGGSLGGTGGSVTLNAAYYSAGTHWLTVIVRKDGISYSRELPFAVAN